MASIKNIAYLIQTLKSEAVAFLLYVYVLKKIRPDKFKFDRWQIWSMLMTIKYKKTTHNRVRGGSKTRDFATMIIFNGIRDNQAYWLTPRTQQLSRAMEYWFENPFVIAFNKTNVKLHIVRLVNGHNIELAVATDGNVTGARKNMIYIDEMAQLKEGVIDYIIPITNGMSYVGDGLRFVYFSTPRINSIFQKYTRKYPEVKINWKIPSWFDKIELALNREEMSPSKWASEYECEFAAQGGKVFDGTIFNQTFVGALDSCTFYGSDPNPVEGYCVVGIKYSVDFDAIVVVFARNFGSGEDNKLRMYDFLKKHVASDSVFAELEDNGVGKPVWDTYQKMGGEGTRLDWGSSFAGSKINRANHINKHKVYIDLDDPSIPSSDKEDWIALYDQVNALQWKKDGKHIDKPSGQEWHLNDSFMHACCFGESEDLIELAYNEEEDAWDYDGSGEIY